ncbi:unnamed protein product [Owenia fusiformis]|uniref:Phosphatidylserine decarboxylase proenzyme, mitochondrial n=1 Tax=Owenia fusiformis TaxID=6347 RepID=A0A8S4Q3P8_OWEFU|nr:unnamed protein product [Owenia fusiformis]
MAAKISMRMMWQCGTATRVIFRTPRERASQIRLQSTGTNSAQSNPFLRYVRTLKWVWIPTGVGLAYISYQQLGHIIKREKRKINQAEEPSAIVAKDWQVSLYKRMPLKAMSRAWGKFNSLDLPMWLRQPAYKLYIWMFDCKLEEAAIEDLKHYKNLGEFFRRSLKPNVRPIAHTASITSPSDGKVLHYGKVEGGYVEQVKGVTYSLQGFLGPPPGPTGENCGTQSDDAFQKCLKHNPDHTALYHCIIYLAPGDYHRFHSPVEWNVHFRRHFPGELFSVNPGVARWIQGLFNFNERAVYTGEWQHGFFSLAAVGATNVGSIKVYCDKDLMTNSHLHKNSPPGTTFDACFTDTNHNDAGINFKKGESFGEFNLGSTIVLIFEAPDTFQFNVEPGQKIKFGQSLGDFSSKKGFEKKTT